MLEIDSDYFTDTLESDFETLVEIKATTIGNQSAKLKVYIIFLSKNSIISVNYPPKFNLPFPEQEAFFNRLIVTKEKEQKQSFIKGREYITTIPMPLIIDIEGDKIGYDVENSQGHLWKFSE